MEINKKDTYKIGQDNINIFGLDIHNPVFAISGLTIIAFIIVTLMFQEAAGSFFNALRPAITNNFDWLFLSAGNIFVIFVIVVAVSPLGRVRLGGKDAKPDFSYLSWFALLFAAGMGIGLVFFGVSEPISHFNSSIGGTVVGADGVRTDWAPLAAAQGNIVEARNLSMSATIFHWGLHPWAMYAIVALALAFFSYNRKLPLTIRSAFYPILGERVWGWPGHIIDILAVFATIFGLATSLGIGTTQALAGFNHLYGWGTGGTAVFILVTFITIIAIISVVRGIDGGVKKLSELNMILAILLMIFILVFGPTADIIATAVSGAGAYILNIIPLSMPFGREDTNFTQGWTSFYWAWWISWSPFVGMFIARVSKGRTIREFIISVMLIPTLFSIMWMAVFGGTAISQIIADAAAPVGSVAQELKLFIMIDPFPLGGILSFVGIILVLVFFISSSDSGSLVVDTITAGGKENAPVQQRIFWATFEGIIAITLLLVGGAGALGALQAMTVSTGLPFTIVLLVMCYCIWVEVSKESKNL